MRLTSIILTELALDKLKAEENLQTIINSSEDSDIKVKRIKLELEKIVNIDNMVTKWKEYISVEEPNNNNK